MFQKLQKRLHRSTWYFTFVALFGSLVALAQEKAISGVVTDENGDRLPGVSVLVKGTQNGASTNGTGEYNISTKANATLIFSFIGYQTKEVQVGNQTQINVTLATDVNNLDEVVVTALGIEKNQRVLTYSAQKVGSGQINEIKDPNFITTLSGKVAGMTITQGAGGPGSAARVVMRGNRSLQGNNNALYVVDGVPIDNTVGGQVSSDFGGYNGSDAISNLNPDDIESVDVLKGAAASVLYGSRAANGVIMITTKKGKSGKVSVDVNSGTSVERPMLLPNLQNTYGQGNGGTSAATSSSSWGGKATTHPDNIKDFFRTALSLNNSVAVTGGSEKMSTYLSYANNYNQGLIDNNDLRRNTLNLRISNQVTSKLSTDAKVTYINQDIQNKFRVGEESGAVMNIYKIPRSVSLESIQQYEDPTTGAPLYWSSSSIYMNPYWTINNLPNSEIRNRVMFMGSVSYQLNSFMKLMGRASVDRYNDKSERKFYNGTLLWAKPGGSYEVLNDNISEQNFELLLTGDKAMGSSLKIDYILGTSLNKRSNERIQNTANGLNIRNKFNLGYATNLNVQEYAIDRELQSVFGKVGFGFKEYLFLDLTARNDWSSTLPKPYSFFYPSVGVTALLSQMMKLPEAVSFAKVRASLTQVGNDAAPYLLTQTYNYGQGGANGFIERDGRKVIEGLKPEITTSLEIGADLRFVKNKYGLDFTYYKTNSRNQLLVLALPVATGFRNQAINSGNIQNQGIELTATAKVLEADKLSWSSTLNFARNRNKIIELNDNIKRSLLGDGFGRSATPVVEEGGSYGDLLAFRWKTNASGQYIVNADGKPVSTSSQENIGNFNPKATVGFSNLFTYKKVSLNVLLTGSFGGVIVSGTDANMAFDGNAAYTASNREGGWILPGVTESGEANKTPITAESFWTTVSGGRYFVGEFFAYDATNVRLKELSLGYTINVNSSFIKSARLALTARNVFFLYRGNALLDIPGIEKRKLPVDPEISLGAGNFQGVEYANLPSSRNVGINLQLSF